MSLKKNRINQTEAETNTQKHNNEIIQIGILFLQKQFQLSKLSQLSAVLLSLYTKLVPIRSGGRAPVPPAGVGQKGGPQI